MSTRISELEKSIWPESDLERVLQCPICRSSSRSVLHVQLIDNTFFSAPGTWTMQQCDGCGSAYLDPRPTEESIARAYAEYYTHSPATGPARGSIKAVLKRLLRAFTDAYVESLKIAKPLNQTPLSMVGAYLIKALPPFREVIDAHYRHLHRPEPGQDRLLDVGCGGGDFLLRAQSLGWKGEGVDFDPKAVLAARSLGLNVSVGSIDSYADVRNVFDVVVCNHVIEHVYDPTHMLAVIYRILKPGGLLWIETPNASSAGHRLFGRSWRGLESPRHIAIFSHNALVEAVRKAGFSVTRETSFNLQHIRSVFASSEAIDALGDPHDTRTPLIPNRRLLRGLWREMLRPERREFVCLHARK